MRRYEPIAGIEGVASGAQATVKVPVNRRVHLIRLYGQGTNSVPATVYAADVIDTVYIYVNGKLMRTNTGAELAFLAAFNDLTLTQPGDGLPIYFSDPKRASVMDEQVTAWDLFEQTDVVLKVALKSGLTGVTLSAEMVYDDGFTTNAKGQRVLNILKHTPFYFNASTSYDITALDIDKPIQRIFLFPASDNTITKVTVVVNDTDYVFEMTQAQNIGMLEDYGLVAESGDGKCFPVVFDMNGQLFDGLPIVRSLRLKVENADGGQIKALLVNRAPGYV